MIRNVLSTSQICKTLPNSDMAKIITINFDGVFTQSRQNITLSVLLI